MPRTHPRSGARGSRARRAVARAAACAVWLALVAFSPPVGSDVLVTDAGGDRFLGVGRVQNGALSLELADATEALRLVVVAPDGSSETWRARFDGERLVVLDGDGEAVDVADALAERDLRLRLVWPGGSGVVRPHASDEGDAAGTAENARGRGDDEGAPGAGPPVDVPAAPDLPLDPPVDPDLQDPDLDAPDLDAPELP